MFKTISLTSVSDPRYVKPSAAEAQASRPASREGTDLSTPPAGLVCPPATEERLKLLDAHGKFVRMIPVSEAHALIRERKAAGLGTKQHIRVVQLLVERKQIEDRDVPNRTLLPSGLVGQKYSHRHEVSETVVDDEGREHPREPIDQNARGCWTLRRLTAKDSRTDLHMHLCYIASLMTCLPKQSQREMIEQLAESRNLKLKDMKLD